MLPQLHTAPLGAGFSVLRLLFVGGSFGMFAGSMFATFFLMGGGAVMILKVLGAIGTVEIVTFAGNGKNGSSHKKQGKRFHRAASIATHHRKATLKNFRNPPISGDGNEGTPEDADTKSEKPTHPNHPATARAACSWAPLPPSLAEVPARRV